MKVLIIMAIVNLLIIGVAFYSTRNGARDAEGLAGFIDIIAVLGCVVLDVIMLAIYFIAKLF